ncbi:MAG: PIN domain-containing protein [Acidobacteriota bacterium]
MKEFLDSSVLVPVFLEGHEHHERSLALFLTCGRGRSACAAHSLAEVYSTLTRLPGKFRVTGDQAMLFLGEIRDRLEVVALSSEEQFHTIQQSAAAGICGGAIYDALIAACANKVKAERLYTWNFRHFAPLGEEWAKRSQTP